MMKLMFEYTVDDKFPVRLYKAELPFHDFYLYFNGSLMEHNRFCRCCMKIFQITSKWDEEGIL